MKVVYFGTPLFAAKTLEHLIEKGVEVVAIISKPDKPKGRSGSLAPTPVKEFAQTLEKAIPVYQPEKVSDPEFAPILKAYDADLFVVVAYGEIIKQHILDMPRLGCINVHASLLPKYRGAAPIQRAIIQGEKESGVSIMHMVRKMDAGNVIKTISVPITEEMTFGELENELLEAGKRALISVIKELDEKGPMPGDPQDETLVTFAPKIELEDCRIDWNLPARQIHDLIRGVNPHPGAWCNVIVKGEAKRLKVLRSQVVQGKKGQVGEHFFHPKEGLIVQCGEGRLRLLEVQLEGKKAMGSEELLRGVVLQSFLLL